MSFDGWTIAARPPRGKYRRDDLYVSLNRRGEIVLSERAFRAIGGPASVTLLWDETRRRIGVKSPVGLDWHFFPARRYGRGRRLRIIRAARMLRQFGISVERTLMFRNVNVMFIGGEPMLVLEMDTAAELFFQRQIKDLPSDRQA